ncbi:MAG: sortase [Candidatus Paceibacterota bacterium]
MLKKSQIKFLSYAIVIFLVLFTLLFLAGLVPESLKPQQEDSFRTLWDKTQAERINDQQKNNGVLVGENPTKIVIEKIGVNIAVINPNTTNVATLDSYLKQGAVRYPGSGTLGLGNMFIFGHSAEAYGVINNPAYRAFDGLNKLQVGDTIKVFGTNQTYIYRVTSVDLVNQDQALVEFNQNKNMLTLSTCNTFGAKEDRYVIEADFAGVMK